MSYDNAGRLNPLTLPNGVVVSYGYDAASRLVSINYDQGTTHLGDLAYQYDAAGRRTRMSGSFARANLPAAVASASYDAANELTQWGAATLSYDADGNLANDGTNLYAWNARNQLASMGAATFAYDGFSRRTLNGAGTSFLYDGVNPVQELSGATPTANLLTGGVDQIFTRTDSAGTRNFLTDALGSTLALTDSSGVVQTAYTYEPFGATTASGATSGNLYQFTGRENDGTGLYYNRARYYDPAIGRFISEDPIGLAGGINEYAYTGGDPVNFRDPFGMDVTVAYYPNAAGGQGHVGVGINTNNTVGFYSSNWFYADLSPFFHVPGEVFDDSSGLRRAD